MNWWSGECTSSSINDVRCDLADLVPEQALTRQKLKKNNKTPSPPRKSACFQVTFQENGWECNLSPGYDGAGTSNITTAAPSYALLSSQVPNFVARMQPRCQHSENAVLSVIMFKSVFHSVSYTRFMFVSVLRVDSVSAYAMFDQRPCLFNLLLCGPKT